MSSNTPKEQHEPNEIQEDIADMILDDQTNTSNSHILEETLFPSNQDDIKESNVEFNNSTLSQKNTNVTEDKKEEKKSESKKLLEGNDNNRSYNNGISPEKKRIKIKSQLSLCLKHYLKSQFKNKISRKNLKILFNKKEIIQKLLEIIEKYKNKKKYILKDILKKNIKKLLKKYTNYKNPKKLLESGYLDVYNLNYLSDSLDIFFLKNKNNDEIFSKNFTPKISDISCNKGIYNTINDETLNMTEYTLDMYFPSFDDNIPNTNYKTIK